MQNMTHGWWWWFRANNWRVFPVRGGGGKTIEMWGWW